MHEGEAQFAQNAKFDGRSGWHDVIHLAVQTWTGQKSSIFSFEA